MSTLLSPDKIVAARALAQGISPGQRVCLTTHVNPDGDGIGSEVALVHLLRAQGVEAIITNPTPTARRFEFLFEQLPAADHTGAAIRELRRADLIIVLDISDLGRLGMLSQCIADGGARLLPRRGCFCGRASFACGRGRRDHGSGI